MAITYIPVLMQIEKLFGFFSKYIFKKIYFLTYGGPNSENEKFRDGSFVALKVLHLLCLERFSLPSKL